MESKLNERRPSDSNMNQFPAVFYPKRSKKLLHALANDISDVIRKTSTTANGGKEAKVVTYEDLIKDPQVMETMKTRLGLSTFFYSFTIIFKCERQSWELLFVSVHCFELEPKFFINGIFSCHFLSSIRSAVYYLETFFFNIVFKKMFQRYF